MPVNLSSPLAQSWKRRLGRWRRSGQSAIEFCRREKISPPRLYTWRRRFAEAPAEPRRRIRSKPAFLPVQVSAAAAPAQGIELAFPTGHVLRLPADVDAGRLAQVVKALAC